jgi:ABC-type multidrug transport system fused ATPase/permease subunit
LQPFRNSTIITVAHRINTVIDSDVIMVLSDGRLVEIGPPAMLAHDVSHRGHLIRRIVPSSHRVCGFRDGTVGA